MHTRHPRQIASTAMAVLALSILAVGCGRVEPTATVALPVEGLAATTPVPEFGTPSPAAPSATPLPLAPSTVSPTPPPPTATLPPPTATPRPPTALPAQPSPTATSAAGPGIFVDSGQRLGMASSFDIALGDLDGDGDLDALVANEGNSALWSNDGDGLFEPSEQRLDSAHGLALGDVDGDGDLDAFFVHQDQPASLWLGDGAGALVRSGQSFDDALGRKVTLGDLDGDGDLDAFVAGTRGSRVWLNDGGGTFDSSGQTLGSRTSDAIALGDVDGDGDLDALVGGWSSSPKLWFNSGAATFDRAEYPPSDGEAVVFGFALGDLDGDGDLDAYMATQSGPLGDQVWMNDGAGVFTNTEQSLPGGYNHDVVLADLDGDGDLDAWVVSGPSPGSANKVWTNQGGEQGGAPGSFEDSGQRLGSSCSMGVAVGDLDGDGDLDAFVANTVIDHPEVDKANLVWTNQTVTRPRGAYFGQEPPGQTPEIFAPGFVSTRDAEFAGTFSPDGREYLFTRRPRMDVSGNQSRIWHTELGAEGWTEPRLAPFTYPIVEFEPFFSPDGRKLYYSTKRPIPNGGGDMHIWVVERHAGGWGEPEPLDWPPAEGFAMYVTATSGGALYFTGRGGIYRSRWLDGHYQPAEKLGQEVNSLGNPAHPYVAPDESYLLFDANPPGSRLPSIYVSFRQAGGTWTEAERLGNEISTDDAELAASVSPDGRFLFFARFVGGSADIYWVDASVLDAYRP